MDGATLGNLTLDGSFFPGLSARWARIGFLLGRRVRSDGKLDFSPCHVGRLDIEGAHVTVEEGVAIDANVLTSERSVEINAHARVVGTVRFLGARVGGQLSVRTSTFRALDDRAFTLHEASVGRAVYLRDATFHGTVNLSGASIGGRLDARDATFRSGRGLAIDLNGCDVKRVVQFDGSRCEGETRMVAGRVGTYFRARRSAELAGPSAEDVAEYGKDDPDLQRLSGFGLFIDRS